MKLISQEKSKPNIFFRKLKENTQDKKLIEEMNQLMLKDSPMTMEKIRQNETVEINLSSDKSAEVSANIDDPDSALGDGISDSQPISGTNI